MADWLTLFAVAAALYLLECCVWVNAAATVCYRRPWRSGVWRVARGGELPGNHRGGVCFLSPLCVSGSVVIPGDWPISISPDGVTNVPATTTFVGSVASRHVPFDSINTVSSQLNQVLINGTLLAHVSSSALADHLARLIQRLRDRPQQRRASIIRSALGDALDRKAAAHAWSAAERRGSRLAPWAGALCVSIFGLSPIVIMTYGPVQTWQLLLALVLCLAIAIALISFRQYRSVLPHLRYDRWANAVSMTLLPLSAIRSSDKLTRDSLFLHSGLVVAPLLVGDRALPYLRSELMDLERLDEVDGAPSELDQCVRWFRATLAVEARTALGDLYERAFEPPVPENATSAAYCPRCHAQYVTADHKVCADCPDVSLRPFDSRPVDSALPGSTIDSFLKSGDC